MLGSFKQPVLQENIKPNPKNEEEIKIEIKVV